MPNSIFNFERISSGHNHNCLIHNSQQSMRCWGLNSFGQSITPELISQSNYVLLNTTLGLGHTCVIYKPTFNKSTGNYIHCWGQDKMGIINVPERVRQNVVSSAAGVEHTCAVSTGAKAVLGNGMGMGSDINELKNLSSP